MRKYTARQLDSMLVRLGHEKQIRKMALELNLAPLDEIATMTSVDVCDLILKAGYTILSPGEEGFFLVKEEDELEVREKLWEISR